MLDLKSSVCDIFEIDSVDVRVPLKELPDWDSLNALSLIALLDSDHNYTISAGELGDLSIEELESRLK